MPFVQVPPNGGSPMKPFDPAKLDTISAGDVNGNEPAAAQTDEDPSESRKARSGIGEVSMALFVVVGLGSLWGWATVNLVQLLLQAQSVQLQNTLLLHQWFAAGR